MAVLVSNTDVKAVLKTLWPQKRINNMVYPDHPFLAMVAKNEAFYGENMVIAVRIGDSQGRSATFATAQANATGFKARKFIITRVKDYQVVSLETEAIMASENDRGALIKALDTEMETGLNNISKSLAVSLFRGAAGAIGTLASDPGTGTTLQLANIDDITSFEVDMQLVFAANTTSALRAGGSRTITAVDRDLGTIEVDAAMDAAVGSGDSIFAEGDYVSSSDRLKVSGLADWLPSTAPVLGSDSFFSVDRGIDPVRLGGLRIDVSGLNPEEGAVTVYSKLSREGGRPSMEFRNHADFRKLEIALGSKVCYEDLSVGEIGFQAIKINGPKGPVRLMADQDCPSGKSYALDMRTWKLHSLKKCPQVLDLDGAELSREASADRWEARIAYFAQLACDAPGWNSVNTLP